jgi:hypothetical protein
MALATLNLFCNITDGTLQMSATDGTPYILPELTVGDELQLVLVFLRRTSGGIRPIFSSVNPSGISCKVAIGPRDGSPDALQTTFAVSGQTLTGVLNLNTAALLSAVNAAEALYLEIKLVESGYAYSVFSERVTVNRSVADAGATAPTPVEDYMTRSESLGTFQKKVGTAGESLILTSAAGVQIALSASDSGTLEVNII